MSSTFVTSHTYPTETRNTDRPFIVYTGKLWPWGDDMACGLILITLYEDACNHADDKRAGGLRSIGEAF